MFHIPATIELDDDLGRAGKPVKKPVRRASYGSSNSQKSGLHMPLGRCRASSWTHHVRWEALAVLRYTTWDSIEQVSSN